MSAKKKLGARAERREKARVAAKLIDGRQKLARMEVGGSPANPFEVVSASLVGVQAASLPCPLCGEKLRIDEHAAKTIDRARLRIVRATCTRCGVPRSFYFRITSTQPN